MKRFLAILISISLFILPVALGSNDYNAISGSYVLKRGAKGSEVRRVQLALINLGYLSGNADGSYGIKTEAAVQRFQWYNGITQNGVATMFTQAKLLGSSAVPIWDNATSFSTPTGLYAVQNTAGYSWNANQASVSFDFVNRDSRTVEAICIYYVAIDSRHNVVNISNSNCWIQWYYGMSLSNQGRKYVSHTLNFTSSEWRKVDSIMCVIGEIAYTDGTVAIPMNAMDLPYNNSGYTLLQKQ